MAMQVSRSKGIRYMFFLILLTLVAHFLTVHDGYGSPRIFREGIVGTLTDGQVPCGDTTIESISFAGDMWGYLQGVVVPMLFDGQDYNGDSLPRVQNQYLLHEVTRVIGGLRIRQVSQYIHRHYTHRHIYILID